MENRRSTRPRVAGSPRLARSLSAALGAMALGSAGAATTVVNTCSEVSGKGVVSLRYAVTHAASGDTVDLSQLACSTITLTQGEVPASVADLTIQSTAGKIVTIDAANASRVFVHTGTGLLSLRYVNVVNGLGTVSSNAATTAGGCVYGDGGLYLDHVGVTHCVASTGAGALRSAGDLTLESSSVSQGQGPGVVESGGAFGALRSTISGNTGSANVVWSLGQLIMDHTTVSENHVGNQFCIVQAEQYASVQYSELSANYAGPNGDALCEKTSLVLFRSTIASNTGGGVRGGSVQLTVTNSTIAYNSYFGAVSYAPQTVLDNSTIAFNGGGGLVVVGGSALDAQSTILAKNGGNDLTAGPNSTIGGNNNLVMTANVALPADTLRNHPRLTPLAPRGGPTRTMGLSISSPAIDAGNDSAGGGSDQRSFGFPRVVGPAADIGAFERQTTDDELFYDGFQ